MNCGEHSAVKVSDYPQFIFAVLRWHEVTDESKSLTNNSVCLSYLNVFHLQNVH